MATGRIRRHVDSTWSPVEEDPEIRKSPEVETSSTPSAQTSEACFLPSDGPLAFGVRSGRLVVIISQRLTWTPENTSCADFLGRPASLVAGSPREDAGRKAVSELLNPGPFNQAAGVRCCLKRRAEPRPRPSPRRAVGDPTAAGRSPRWPRRNFSVAPDRRIPAGVGRGRRFGQPLKITAEIAKMHDCLTTSQKVSRLNRNSKLPSPTKRCIDLLRVDRWTE